MNFRFALILLQNVHEFLHLATITHCGNAWHNAISQHNFVSGLDRDLEAGSFSIVFSGHHSLYYSLFLPQKNNTKGRRADYTFFYGKATMSL